VVSQAKPLMAANEEVRPRAVRVNWCERRCPLAYPGGTNRERSNDRTYAFFKSFLFQNPILDRFPSLRKLQCVTENR
jgi:hypothetical protein